MLSRAFQWSEGGNPAFLNLSRVEDAAFAGRGADCAGQPGAAALSTGRGGGSEEHAGDSVDFAAGGRRSVRGAGEAVSRHSFNLRRNYGSLTSFGMTRTEVTPITSRKLTL